MLQRKYMDSDSTARECQFPKDSTNTWEMAIEFSFAVHELNNVDDQVLFPFGMENRDTPSRSGGS